MAELVSHLPKFISEKAALLERAGIESSHAELEWILCHVLEIDRLHLYLYGTTLLNQERIDKIDQIIARRVTREPLQYILEESWFYGRKFYVNPSVMAPTPETELLCETAIRFAKAKHLDRIKIVDVGTGSGVIAVTMARELPQSGVVALDLSTEALDVARRNAQNHGVLDRIALRHSDLFSSLDINDEFDLILSNPPYIAEPDYAGLAPEVKADPKMAMTAGDEGMDIIRRLIAEAPNYLAPGGRIIFEIGYGQSPRIAEITSGDPRYASLSILKDLNDIDRLVVLACGAA